MINSKNIFLSWVRLIRKIVLYQYSSFQSRFSANSEPQHYPTIFVIGCGRSGTTILGKMLQCHPEVFYLNEPLHLWAAVDPYLDLTGFYTSGEVGAIIDKTFYSKAAQDRFNRLFYRTFQQGSTINHLIEKTPHNALRLDYLDKLVPDAFFLNIVRDGIEVAESINKLSTENVYKIAFMPFFNQWWGTNNCKWKAIKRDGIINYGLSEEVDLLVTNEQMGAYEWLLSMKEVDKYRPVLGECLLEIKYTDLIFDGTAVMIKIANHFDLKIDSTWLKNSVNMISPKNAVYKLREPLVLPQNICEQFNHYQQRYGFSNRAKPLN